MPPHLITKRRRGNSLSAIPPSPTSIDYSVNLAKIASRVLYRSPLPSQRDLPVYILDTGALPDTKEIGLDILLPYVLARLPDEEQLIGGKGYEVILFAGGEERASGAKKSRPSWGFLVQAYHVLTRAMRKRLQKLYLVHERRWVRVISELFSSIVSPKFRRKVVHVSSLSALGLHIPIEDLLIPPSAYFYDRRVSPDIHVPYASGRRAFGASRPLPTAKDGSLRFPRVLRETTNFVLADKNVSTEGLFRVNARAIALEVLKEAYDRGQKFLIWKDGDVVMTFPQYKDGFGNVTVDELDSADGYGVLTAAGLIKLWYADLREPIFPPSSYAFLERVYGDKDKEIELPVLLDLIGESSEWSQISKMSKAILTLHLFPMLAEISKHEENRMDARNLAVCFAPSLLCGPDPIQDAKVVGVIRRIVEFAVAKWDSGLAEACGNPNIEQLLRLPDAVEDREDLLDSDARPSITSVHQEQTEGIVMLENDDTSETDGEDAAPPPLPERKPTDATITGSMTSPLRNLTDPTLQTVKRKPMPPDTQAPPRYSTLIGAMPAQVAASPADQSDQPENLPINSLSLDSDKQQPLADYEEGNATVHGAVQRKPLPKN